MVSSIEIQGIIWPAAAVLGYLVTAVVVLCCSVVS